MPNFEFIEDAGFRASLESDYAEMHRCFDNGAWKSVQVLGGSIVEAFLIDYLLATHTLRGGKDPLKMDLADAISICRSEKVLTERTADLCSVIRSYRNLIHPGRMIRLDEELPSESSARIAVALIELICGEVAEVRKSKFGLTGEQIVTKVERDANAVSILKHLLIDVNTRQKERILLNLLPVRYFELRAADEGPFSSSDYSVTIRDLRRAFRIVFEASPEAIKVKAAQQFVTKLREADGYEVLAYAEAFFEPSDLAFLPAAQHSIVKEFYFSRIGSIFTAKDIEFVRGLEKHLSVDDVNRWVDPIVRALTSTTMEERERKQIRGHLLYSAFLVPTEVEKRVQVRLEDWAKIFSVRGRETDAEMMRALVSDWRAEIDLPF